MDDGRRKGSGKRDARSTDALRGKVRPHDPFELIRWLALSQPDPRKALAELVQNSLDAGAGRVRVTRVRERGAPCLKIWDDGAGVIPELPRPDALKYIATHVGHSRKRALSPQERLQLMTQGQYGIGLLGFWSLGERLEMRSCVPGQQAYRLVLHRDRPHYTIERLRGRLELDERWTEVVVVGLHREALGALLGRRAADYLAAELRGQLLSRDVELIVEDRMSRGNAPKEVEVRPRRFLGERLEGIGPVEVPGHPPIRFEVYVTGETEDRGQGLSLYAAGTLVAESFRELATLGLDAVPWTDSRLTGLVDFPGLSVAPGARRGIGLDAAAGLFAEALAHVAPILNGVLDALERRRAEELDRSLMRDLQRAFRGLHRERPQYTMLPVSRGGDAGEGGEPSLLAEGAIALPSRPTLEGDRRRVGPLDLLPPGPLEALRVRPDPVRIAPSATRSVRAEGFDATGRKVDGPVLFRAELSPDCGKIEPAACEDGRFVISAADEEAHGTLRVTADADGRSVAREVEVALVDDGVGASLSAGIPHPELLHQPGAPWRSRMVEDVWQVNTGHHDFRVVAGRPAQKLRYMALLFAKEIVLRSSRDPRLDPSLEQLVEIASYADSNLARGRPPRKTPSDD